MSDLPRKYQRMARSKLNELALAGDLDARRALALHATLDGLIEKTDRLSQKISLTRAT